MMEASQFLRYTDGPQDCRCPHMILGDESSAVAGCAVWPTGSAFPEVETKDELRLRKVAEKASRKPESTSEETTEVEEMVEMKE